MQLGKVFQNVLTLNKIDQFQDLEIGGLTQDTREVQPGYIFICIAGNHVDGHTLAQAALEKGAVAIIAEKKLAPELPVILVPSTNKALAQLANNFYGHPSQKLSLIGVTGTNGKTTITHILKHIFQSVGEKPGLIGTMYDAIGDKIISTNNTTPDALTLQKLFAEMVQENVHHVAMEVSSHALTLGRTWGTDFSVAVFTNLTQDHLDFHGTMENYLAAKSLLFSQLGNSYHQKKTAVINIDDPAGEKLSQVTGQNVLTYGFHHHALLQAKNIQTTQKSTHFELSYLGENYLVSTQLIGEFNVYNTLAAIGAALASGLSLTQIIDALQTFLGCKGRFEQLTTAKHVTAIIDYAHTPDGLLNVLTEAQKIKTGKLICVVGCGGDRDKTKRPIMAEIATTHSDFTFFTSDNPRTEDPEAILDDMISSLTTNNFSRITDRKLAIQAALDLAQPNDFVLIAGKGHENYQIIGEVKHHFDDREIVEEYSLVGV